jgi:anti-sigma factor RsiW
MRRRRYLGVLAAAAVAGCGGTPTKSVGESVTHDGVQATVPEFIIAEEVTTYSNQ